jgi:formimidoylglutamate deiminase
LLNVYYERGGFAGQPLSEAQKRFQTADLEGYWAQMDRLTGKLNTKRGEVLGVVAHSLRAVCVPSLKAISAEAARRGLVLHLHLEEQPKEIEDCIAAHGVTPLALLLGSIDINGSVTAVHCTQSDLTELSKFSEAGGNVCICPLTEGCLGDGVFKPLESTHGNVCLGSDCNARIDMFEEMRWLEYTQRLKRGQRGAFSAVSGEPELSHKLFECATIHGAHSLGIDTGTIESGKWADFVLLDLSANALAGSKPEHLLGAAIFGGAGEGLVVNTCVGGKWTKQ